MIFKNNKYYVIHEKWYPWGLNGEPNIVLSNVVYVTKNYKEAEEVKHKLEKENCSDMMYIQNDGAVYRPVYDIQEVINRLERI